MGYTISINCRSQQAQVRMLKFLGAHFRSWVTLTGQGDKMRGISDPIHNLDYAHGKHQIGFDYKSWWGGNEDERDYYHAALRWMAIQVGQRRRAVRLEDHNKIYKFDKPVPVFIYDGCDHWPILLDRPKTSKLSWCWVDRLGMVRDKASIAGRYRLLIWRHLITPMPRKKGKKDQVHIKDEVWTTLGLTPQDEVPILTLEMQVKLVRKLLWKETIAKRAPIIAELQRLDDLWRKEA